jgi:hypothetical protein
VDLEEGEWMDARSVLAWRVGRRSSRFKTGMGELIGIGKSGLCAFISVSWMMSMSIVFFFPTTMHTNAQGMNYTSVVLGGVLILSLLWFYLPVYGGVHWFKGPVRTVEGHVTRRKWAAEQEKGGEEAGADSL